MQEQMACLLLLTVSVALASVVAAYAVAITEQTVDPDNIQSEKIQDLSQQLLNYTQNLFNELPENDSSTNSTTP